MGGATYRAGLSLVFLVTLIPPRIGICHWGEHARGPWDIRDRPQVLSEMGEGGLVFPLAGGTETLTSAGGHV